MSINWYPGHMHKARREIADVLNNMDLLIEVVDARLPYSSQNPVIESLRRNTPTNTPTIVVLNKCDLADENVTQQWQEHYLAQKNIKTITCQLDSPEKTRQILTMCKSIAGERDASFKAINAMIVGIPNVGKSTIINTLAGKVIAKTGNEPAVTKRQQKINLAHDIILHDTPGILWPKIENPHSGYRLAISGAIKDTAIEYDDIGYYAAEYLLKEYPERLSIRYKIDNLPTDAISFLEVLGEKRGAKQSGGRINLHKTYEILLHEFRQGTLGSITLEKPEMIINEMQEVERKKQEKAEKKSQRRKNHTKK
ncbi:ribosome biogenesis GTPase YlqF [Eionea flava]